MKYASAIAVLFLSLVHLSLVNARDMIARVSLEIALRKEFDYLIPPGLAGQIEVGSRVQVPFGARKIFGCRHRAGRGIRARQSQTHSQSHRRANPGHAESSETRALDCRLLLLRAGNRA